MTLYYMFQAAAIVVLIRSILAWRRKEEFKALYFAVLAIAIVAVCP